MVRVVKSLVQDSCFKIPKHIAIICDGNGRWAKKRGLPRSYGHKAGTKPVEEMTKMCAELGVQVLTFFVFSTENWKRSAEEVGFLVQLFVEFFRKLQKEAGKDIKVRHLGIKDNLPMELREEIEKTERLTAENTGMVLNVALNYGGRSEIAIAAQKAIHDIEEKKLSCEKIDEAVLNKYMFTSGMPDVDLLIRTSGEFRISNFLLWQCAKATIWITEDFWPDFRYRHLQKAIRYYSTQ